MIRTFHFCSQQLWSLNIVLILNILGVNRQRKMGLLNSQKGYIKIEAYLQQILCHMNSDVKLSHCYRLIKVKQRSSLKSFRKQFQSTTHSASAGKLQHGWVNITANCYFNWNVLKFEMQYERISSVFKNSWNWNLADFRDLGLILPEATKEVFYEKGVLKSSQYLLENTCARVSFLLKILSKLYYSLLKIETLAQGFSCEFCKIFRNPFLQSTSSILQQLLASYFAIIYSWQSSTCKKSLVGKSSTYLKEFYRFHLRRYFFQFLWEIYVYLPVYTKSMLYSGQPTVILARRHLNTVLFTISAKILKI